MLTVSHEMFGHLIDGAASTFARDGGRVGLLALIDDAAKRMIEGNRSVKGLEFKASIFNFSRLRIREKIAGLITSCSF